MKGGGRVGPAELALFASLYAVQGVVVAYFFTYNQIYMIESGVAERDAADVQSIALVPFILKFLGGPVSDRFNLLGFGHRKPYIVLGLVMQTLGLLGLSLIDPGRALAAFAATAVVTVAGLALFDTCCDGMVVDVTPPEGRARVQGILWGSRFLAATACSLLFGIWLDQAPGAGPGRFHRVLLACAALGLIPLVQALFVAEPSRAADAERFTWRALGVLVRPWSLVLLAFGAFYAVVALGVEINLGPYYKALRFPDREVGAFASARYLGRAAGAGLLGVASRWLGRGWILAVGVLALAATTAAQAAVGGPASAGLAGFAFGAANGWDDALFCVLAMEAADPRMAASTYALFMAVTNVSVLGGSLFARLKTGLGGYPPAFLASAALSLMALALVPSLARPAPRPKPEPVDVDA
jgi:MFS transporter, PAT family, beta-lactamase induction signal transducer AmpG